MPQYLWIFVPPVVSLKDTLAAETSAGLNTKYHHHNKTRIQSSSSLKQKLTSSKTGQRHPCERSSDPVQARQTPDSSTDRVVRPHHTPTPVRSESEVLAMSVTYSSSPLVGSSIDQNIPKAPQACMSCRKQKRKCNKGLPACSLCERMGRLCDYSDASPAPTSDDFNALRQKLLELERRLNGTNGSNVIETPAYLPTPSASTVSAPVDSVGATPNAVYIQQDPTYQNVQNRFPGIAFLDSEAFKYGQIVVPKPTVDIPVVSAKISLNFTKLLLFACVFYISHEWLYI